jgi:hypothetical protein
LCGFPANAIVPQDEKYIDAQQKKSSTLRLQGTTIPTIAIFQPEVLFLSPLNLML